MKILALDTATEACSVALSLDAGPGGRVFERYLELERGHAEQLLPMVDEVLAEAGCELASLDAIAFGRGPGGFTGVRLAASVAQGLAFGAGLGVLPVSDLAAVALRAASMYSQARRVLVVNDARMREVYWAHFSNQGAPAGDERVGPAASVELPDSTGHAEVWIAAGRGLAAWPELAERCRGQGAAAVIPDLLPRAAEVLALARLDAAAGRMLHPEAALPVYVRDKVADASPS
jgi:tRNA threonylcarbamoyladenosine biosynthesis protein TsaB